MHKRTQILTSILCLILAISMVPSVAFADDSDSDAAPDTEAVAETDAVVEGAADDIELLELDDETQATINLFSGMEEAGISYLYLPTPAVYVGETLDVLVGLEDETVVAEDAALTYINVYTEEETTLSASSLEEGAFSFQYVYASESATGFYKLTSLSYVVGDETVTAVLDEEQEIIFEVVPAATDETGITAYALAEDGALVASAELDEVLDTAAEGADALSDDATSSEEVTLEAQDDIVRIMLDPGHCSLSGGAGYNGLSETTINLKIAQYCKAELEEYNGVEVYMTRTSNDCPNPNATSIHPTYHGNSNPHNLADIMCRIDQAIALNCDAYISLHINSGGGPGAEVWVSNTSYSNSDVSSKIADRIQAQLVSLGLHNRGVHVDGAYPNGYRVTMYGGERGIPSMIVEHAFIDGDYAFLSSEANLKKLGIADATGIAKYFNLTKEHAPEPKVTQTGDQYVTLSWEAIERATKYSVSIYQEDGTLYNIIPDCTALTYTIRGLENDVTYRFLVQAYVNGKWSSYSEANLVSGTPHAESTVEPAEHIAYPIIREYSGGDRYAVASAAAVQNAATLVAADRTVTGVIVVSGENNKYPDALSASGLSGAIGYPVVVVRGTGLTDSDKAALQAYRDAAGAPLDIIVVGGTATIPESTVSSLGAYGTVTKRLSGNDRYAVNAAVYQYGSDAGAWATSQVFIARADNFPDALTIAPYLASHGCPLILVNPKATTLTATQVSMLSGAEEVIVLGGTASVSDGIYNAAGATARLAGANRYEASANIVAWELEHGMSMNGMGIATGASFADALSSAPLLGANSSVLCLVSDDTVTNSAVYDKLSDYAESNLCAMVRFFGGTTSVPGHIRYEVTQALTEPGTVDANRNLNLYSGADRYAVAAMNAIETASSSDFNGIIVVSGENGKYPDALSASGLSGVLDYSIVVVNGTGLTDSNRLALQTYKDNYEATHEGSMDILIIGGTATVSEDVAADLAAYGTVSERIAGSDRFAVNAAVYEYGATHGGWDTDYCFIARGDGFADALGIAPYLAANGCALILVSPKDTTLDETKAAMVAGSDNCVILGGTASVSEGVYEAADGVDRLAGATRYSAASQIIAWELDHDMYLDGMGIATGESFADALSSVSLLANTNSVLCLASPKTSANDDTCTVLSARSGGNPPSLTRVFGGLASVPVATREQVLLALAGIIETNAVAVGKPVPTATAVNGGVRLSWTAVPDATRYQVAMLDSTGAYKTITLNCTGTSYTVTGLSNGTRYTFLVRAYSGGSWSNFTDADYITAVAGDTASPVVKVRVGDDGSLTLSWQAVPGASVYSIEERNASGGLVREIAGDYTGLSYTITDYNDNITRYYLVQSRIGGNWSSDATTVYVKVSSEAVGLYAIMGTSSYTAADLANCYRASGYTYPAYYQTHGGAPTIDVFCQMIVEEATAEGVKPEVLFGQIMHETGWLQFGNLVKIEQLNFGGLGATGPGFPGITFPNTRTGLRAQVQHLKAYASTDSLNNACVDERFNYVIRGCAPYVEWLGKADNPYGGGWAVPGAGYGRSILNIIARL